MAADTRGIRAGRAFVELGVSDKLTSALKAAEKRLRAFGAGVRDIGVKLFAVGSAATGAFLTTAKIFADVGDALEEMSQRTGVSVEALSEIGFAAELSGANMETLEKGLRAMQRTIVEAGSGSKSAADALGRIGLNVDELLALSPEHQFKAIADQMARITDPTIRAATALDIFSRSGTQLLPLMAEGAAGIEALQSQAREFGLTIGTQDAKAAALLNDTFNILWRTLKNVGFTIGSVLAPLLTDVADQMARVGAGVADWVRQNKPLIASAFKVAVGVTAVGAAMIALGTAIVGAGAVLGTLATAVTTVGSVIAALTSPIALASGAIAALSVAIVKYTGVGRQAVAWLGKQFGALKDWIGDVVGGISDALAAGDITLAAKVLWSSLKVVWEQGAVSLQRIWERMKAALLTVFTDLWDGTRAAFEIGRSWIEDGWIETTAFMSSTWTRFLSGIQRAWNVVATWFKKRWVELRGVFDEAIDVEAQKKALDQALAAENRDVRDETAGALARREEERLRARAAAQRKHEERMAGIGRDNLDTLGVFEAQANARIAESEADLARARKELADALAAARNVRTLAAPDIGEKPFSVPSLEDIEARVSAASARSVVAGTFNPFAVAGLAGRTTLDDLKQRMEELIRKAEETNRLLTRGGLKFAY